MQLKSLRMFEAVCDSGSFGLAAQQLNTVQSNVTAHVQKLEDEVDAQLLVRASPVFPTPAGRTLLEHARQMLRLHDQVLTLLQTPLCGTETVRGVLRIGSMESTAALHLPALFSELRRLHPAIDLELIPQPSATLLMELQGGHLDCAFINGPAAQDTLQSWPVFREELVLVSQQRLTRLPSTDELSNAVFLAFRQGCSYRQRIELLMASQGIHAVRIMELGMLDTILGCVAAGMGYALLPRALVEVQQPRFSVHCLSLPGAAGRRLAMVETCFVTGKQAGWSPAMHAFASILGIDADTHCPPTRSSMEPLVLAD